jgi:hypothetical protein
MSGSVPSTNAPKRRRLVPLVWLGSLAAVIMLALGINGTLSAWTAQIVNTTNTAGTGTLVMEEDGPTGTPVCTSNTVSASCSTINKYGGNLVMAPGVPVVTTITIKNTGTVPAVSFTLQAGACTQLPVAAPVGPPIVGNLCSQMQIAVVGSTAPTNVFTGTPTAFATAGTGGIITLTQPLAPAGVETFTFTVTVPAGSDNTYQGISISQPLTWTFGA